MVECRVAVAIGLLGVALAGCAPSPLPKTRVEIEDRYPDITNLAIVVDADATDPRTIEAAGAAIGALTLSSRRDLPKSPDKFVGVEVRAGGKRVMHLTYTVAALGEVRGRKPAEILGAAENGGHWTPDNDHVIERFCFDHAETVYCQRVKANEL